MQEKLNPREGSSGFESRPAKVGHQPEASLASKRSNPRGEAWTASM